MDNSSAAKSARYRAKDIDAYRKRKAEYARTPEQRKTRAEYMRVWRSKEDNRLKNCFYANRYRNQNKEACKKRGMEWHYKTKYGITVEQRDVMVRLQSNKCLICASVFLSSRLTHIDHNHTTGKIRGVLCSRCNGALGWFEEYRQGIEHYIDTVRT